MKFKLIILLLILGGCVLNAHQEKTLSEAQRMFLDAHNNGDVLKYVGLTHPNAVMYYKQQGDSVFSDKFDLSKDVHLQDGTIKQSIRNDNRLQVKVQLTKIDLDHYGDEADRVEFIGMSEDDGETWFFIELKDYLNDSIIAENQRLIISE